MAIRVQKRKVPRYTCYSSQPPILNPNRSTVARSTLTNYYSNFCHLFLSIDKNLRIYALSLYRPRLDENIPLYAIVFFSLK